MLFVAIEFWSIVKMKNITVAALVMHEMIVEKRRTSHNCVGTDRCSIAIDSNETISEITFTASSTGSNPLLLTSSVSVSEDIMVCSIHRDLIDALSEHQWNAFG